MTDHTTAAQADDKEIRAGFELCYATDADDPANVTDLGHFTNGWRACIISHLRAPVADERADVRAMLASFGAADCREGSRALGHSGPENGEWEDYIEVPTQTLDRIRAALASATVAGQQQWRIRIAGPAGYERFESFNGSSLDDACAAARMQGFICCQDEDGHVIVEDSPARTVEVQHSAPVAGEAQNPVAVTDHRGDVHWKHGCKPGIAFHASPQASEAARILFPTHLRKMWSGGEVQAWLDEHQGVTPPKPSARGSLERYRKWQAKQSVAPELAKGCHRSHPHEKMSPECEAKTIQARADNAAAQDVPQASEADAVALSTAVDYRGMGDAPKVSARVVAAFDKLRVIPILQFTADRLWVAGHSIQSPAQAAQAAALAPVKDTPHKPMTLGEILAEYRKGCSNTLGEGPENCPECVQAFVKALEALNERQAQPGDMAYMAQLRSALILARDSHGVCLLTDPPQDAWQARRVNEVIRAALAEGQDGGAVYG